MNKIHWTGVFIFVIAYFIGAKYPSIAKKTGLV